MVKNWFSYGPTNGSQYKSNTFGLLVTAQNTFDSPVRDTTTYSVPGMNGDVIIDNGRFKNVSVSYEIVLIGATNAKMDAIRQWLCGFTGYQRIYDSYDTSIYREGVFSSNINWTMTQLMAHGKAKVTFNCKPQRWSIDEWKTLIKNNTENNTLTNPYNTTAYPLIKITTNTGTSSMTYISADLTIGINSTTAIFVTSILNNVTFDSVHGEIFVDLDKLQSYYYKTNSAGKLEKIMIPLDVRLQQGSQVMNYIEKPGVGPNESKVFNYTVSWINGGSQSQMPCTVQVLPRWWRL